MPSGGYFEAATACSVSALVVTMGTMTSLAPASSANLMAATSLHATRIRASAFVPVSIEIGPCSVDQYDIEAHMGANLSEFGGWAREPDAERDAIRSLNAPCGADDRTSACGGPPASPQAGSATVSWSAGIRISSSSQSSDQPTTVCRIPGGCTQHERATSLCGPSPSKSVSNQPFRQ